MKTFTSVLSCFLLFLAGVLQAQDSIDWSAVKVSDDHPVVDIIMPGSIQQRLIEARSMKLIVKDLSLKVDGEKAAVKKLKIRGRSSLNYRRKSFTVTLEEPLLLPFDSGPVALRKFYLVSLNMDRSYFHNKLAFGCLKELGLFELKNSFTELRINGRSEGVYLILQRPEDYVLDELGGAYIMRRGYREKIDEFDVGDKVRKREAKACSQRFSELAGLCEKLNGEALYRELTKHLDLTGYMRWMAFNYWLRNGDYTDELYFYTLDTEPPVFFHILPWDYDDIFAPHPHEGNSARAHRIGNKLIYSTESVLDVTIANDDYLYALYKEELRNVLRQLSPEKLRRIIEGIYAELYPYYQDKPLIDMSQYDRGGATNLPSFQRELSQVYYHYLLQRKAEILARLEEG